MVPVGDVGLDEPLVVVEQAVDRLRLLGRRRGGARAHVPGRNRGEHGIVADPLQVVGDQVRRPVHGRAELVGGKVSRHGSRTQRNGRRLPGKVIAGGPARCCCTETRRRRRI